MPWEEIPVGTRASSGSSEFILVVGKPTKAGKAGNIRISIPHGHALASAARVKTLIGSGDQAGWIRLMGVEDSQAGRKLHTPCKGARKHIIFASLPNAPRGPLSETVEWANGAKPEIVDIKLPWAGAFLARPALVAPSRPVSSPPFKMR